MIKILLTGSTGFFGEYFNKLLNRNYIIFNILNKSDNKNLKNKFKLNLNNQKKIDLFIKKFSPNLIVHAAAITDVDYCEKYKKKALISNFVITKKLVNAAKKYKKFLVFISSDQLFDGSKKKYNEKSVYSPCNFYANTKMQSEKYIKKNLKDYLIIRTNFFGKSPKGRKSFSDFITKNIQNKKKIKLFEDVMFNPVHLSTLIKILEKLIVLKKKGIFNVSSDKPISKYQFGKKIIKKLNLDERYLFKSNLNENKSFLAKRPKNMFIDNFKIKNILHIKEININHEIKKLIK